MNGRYFTGEPIEQRLDRLIDALNSGNAPDSLVRDPELDELASALLATASVREVQWPTPGFGPRVAARLAAELRQPTHGDARNVDSRMLNLPASPPSLNGNAPEVTGDRNTFELTHPGHRSRFRAFAGIAAAFAGFALLAYVLAAVFGGASDNSLLGGAPNADQNQLAFVKSVDGSLEIFLANEDGTTQVNLTNHPANDTMPAWSPDGVRLAFVSDRSGSDALYVMNADGSSLIEVFAPALADGESLRNIAWSPDGDAVAVMRFSGSDDGAGPGEDAAGIVLASLDGGHRVISAGNAVFDQLPAWSSDGTALAYSAGWDAREGGYLFISSLAASSDASIQPVNTASGEPLTGRDVSWSKSGDLALATGNGIAIARPVTESTEYRIITEIPVSAAAAVRRTRWSPDGERLVASLSTQTLWLVNRDGSGLIEIADTEPGTYPEWQQNGAWSPDPAWSHDGSALAYLRANDSLDQPASFELVVVDADDGSTLATIATNLTGPPLSPPAWRPAVQAGGDEVQALASVTPTSSNDERMYLVPTPPSTPNASITVVPYELTCESSAAVIGRNFRPSAAVDIYPATHDEYWPGGEPVASAIVGDDGSFNLDRLVAVRALIPNCDAVAASGGGELNVSVEAHYEGEDGARSATGALASVFLAPSSSASLGATLTLDPPVGTCQETVTAYGTGFEPGTQVTVSAVQSPGDNPTILDQHPIVTEDGTFEVGLDLNRATRCELIPEIPEAGLPFVFGVQTGLGSKPGGDVWRDPSAEANFTLLPDDDGAAPETSEQETIDHANTAAREFPGESDTEFEVVEVNQETHYVRISRQIDGAYDEFRHNTANGEIVDATIQSHAGGFSPTNPVNAAQAFEIAEVAARDLHVGFEQLTLSESTA